MEKKSKHILRTCLRQRVQHKLIPVRCTLFKEKKNSQLPIKKMQFEAYFDKKVRNLLGMLTLIV